MHDPTDLVELLRRWVRKAENDLRSAAHNLKLRKKCPTDAVCFHAQQCVEKYVKALLVLRGVEFQKTHDVGDLVRLLPPGLRPRFAEGQEEALTTYATVTRYPGPYADPTLSEARKAVAAARRVKAFARRHLPRAALRAGGRERRAGRPGT